MPCRDSLGIVAPLQDDEEEEDLGPAVAAVAAIRPISAESPRREHSVRLKMRGFDDGHHCCRSRSLALRSFLRPVTCLKGKLVVL